jgi:hypothetical protein
MRIVDGVVTLRPVIVPRGSRIVVAVPSVMATIIVLVGERRRHTCHT